ncbi:ABC transporter substrate-binding protein [Pseudoalteromonas sp.]|uniref:ABC transporter substrate-binding protein n=1 Tax=Pseudoalteromonas sp. TaxID=53249 RepID=UPI0035631AE2
MAFFGYCICNKDHVGQYMHFFHRLMLFSFLLTSTQLLAEKRVFNIYHDSDYTNHGQSAKAMKIGFMTALSQQQLKFDNIEFNFIEKDHRGNSNRSLMHMKQFLADPNALFMLGGLHSPPYIKYKNFINQNDILLLVPWAAGGPITRYDAGKNWVYRLSVDDTKAGYRIVRYAQQQRKCQRPQMLLEKTPWGESNYATMSKALESNAENSVTWFRWNTKINQAKIMLRDIANKQADCILFVGNAIEGRQFIEAMANLPVSQRMPIISHWGITGGDFFNNVHQYLESDVDLNFIQSCFSLRDDNKSAFTKKAIADAKALFPDTFVDEKTLPAPAGFIHAYDLANVFLTAFESTPLDKDIKITRAALHQQLESINTPVTGLIKTYHKPFSAWSNDLQDAHEALDLDDLCMAKYMPDGGINVFKN